MNKSGQPVILQVLPKLYETGGVERGTVEIARALAQHGFESLVASAEGPMVPKLVHAGGRHLPLPLDTKAPLKLWLNHLRLVELIRKHKVDIVHARSRAPAWSAYLAAQKCGVPFMTTFHGVYGLQNKWKQRYNSVMVKGERIIAVSHFIAEHIRAHYEVDQSKIRVIQRGADLDAFNPSRVSRQRMADLLKKWAIPEHLPIILFPGRITRWKGQDIFIKALGNIPHRHFYAVLVGDDTQHDAFKNEVEQLIHEHKLVGNVRMVGSTPHMVEAYHLAKFVVATSTEPEAFGRVVVEAQAMGKAVIATNHGGARETVIENQTGWLVEPGNIDALSNLIAFALTASDRDLGQIGQQGMENARNFSTQAMCSKTLSVYRELLHFNS